MGKLTETYGNNPFVQMMTTGESGNKPTENVIKKQKADTTICSTEPKSYVSTQSITFNQVVDKSDYRTRQILVIKTATADNTETCTSKKSGTTKPKALDDTIDNNLLASQTKTHEDPSKLSFEEKKQVFQILDTGRTTDNVRSSVAFERAIDADQKERNKKIDESLAPSYQLEYRRTVKKAHLDFDPSIYTLAFDLDDDEAATKTPDTVLVPKPQKKIGSRIGKLLSIWEKPTDTKSL